MDGSQSARQISRSNRNGGKGAIVQPRRPFRRLALLLGLCCILIAFQRETAAMGPVREPAVAGTFYPEDPETLRSVVDKCIDSAEKVPALDGCSLLLSPHAGYMYSGKVAGAAFRQVEGKSFKTVVVIAPSHRVPFNGASVWAQGAYRTPLGIVPVDEKYAKKLVDASPVIRDYPKAHIPEHSLEVELPFLQVALQEGWKLVPVIMGSHDPEIARAVADGIEKAIPEFETLIVASSDLSHFHTGPEAERIDKTAVERMVAMDTDGLWDLIEKREVEACGIGPILVLMNIAKEREIRQGALLRYSHSGAVTGDLKSVVGYAAVAWCTADQDRKKEGADVVGVDLGLTEEEKRTLKKIAKTTIECCLDNKPFPEFEGLTETLKEPRGAFVTLEKNHRLRGCIGLIEPVKPLYLTIREMAEAAAFRDPRFPPLKKEEFADLDIEISVLTPMREIQDVNEIQVGKHGILISRGMNRGLLLPQVATDYGWDRETFLKHTCQKANLPEDAWKKSDTKIMIFSADIF